MARKDAQLKYARSQSQVGNIHIMPLNQEVSEKLKVVLGIAKTSLKGVLEINLI